MSLKISKGNSKVGKIHNFSITAKESCPGKTEWCSKLCYALKFSARYSNVKKAYASNLEATKSDTFVAEMKKELDKLVKKGVTVFRLHVSGDFYSVNYINKWINIVPQYPSITFFAYTKSWSHDTMLPALETLNKFSNVVLFASTDTTSTSKPPIVFREAYAGDVKPTTVGKLVTCLEQANKVSTCTECKLCFNPSSTVNIFFETH